MPFTLSHVAAVVPLARRPGRWWVASGLVAGAMAPDVPFFLESLLPGAYRYGALTHRVRSVPALDVLLAAGMAAVWHGLLRERAMAMLPGPVRLAPLEGRRRPARAAGAAASAAAFAGSAAVGAASHLAWDSFTHPGRAGVRAVPVLARPAAFGVPGCTVLQYATSVAGLAVLADEACRWAPPTAWAAAVRRHPIAAAGLGTAAAAGAVHRLARRDRGVIDEFCFGAGTGLVVGAVGLAALSAAGRRVAGAARWARP